MNNKQLMWFLLIVISFIWGSSFYFDEESFNTSNPYTDRNTKNYTYIDHFGSDILGCFG